MSTTKKQDKNKDAGAEAPAVQTKPKKEQSAASKLVAELNKKYGSNVVCVLGENLEQVDWEFLPTGSIGLDILIGGGVPLGAPITMYGRESVGKTTLAILIMIAFQQAGLNTAVIDAEQSFDPKWARLLGLFIPEHDEPYPDGYGQIIFHQPMVEAEKTMDFVEELIDSGLFGLVLVDSIPALVTKNEIDGGFADKQVGETARLMAKAMRKLVYAGKLKKNKTTLIAINQMRAAIGSYMGGMEQTGGNALKFASVLSLEVVRAGKIEEGTKDDKRQVGHVMGIKGAKNKCGIPHRYHELTLFYDSGVDRLEEAVLLGEKLGPVVKAGGWYSYVDTTTGELITKAQGRDKFKQAFVDDPTLYDRLFAEIQNIVRG